MSLKIGICSPILVGPFSKHINPTNPEYLKLGTGGDGVVRIILGLLNMGYQIEVFTLDPNINEEIHIHGDNIKIHIFPSRGKIKIIDVFSKEISYLKKIINKSDIDIIHAHWSYEYAIAALKSNKPHVITVRDNALNVLKNFNDKIYRLVRYFMNEYVLSHAKNLIANSLYIQKYLEKKTRREIDIIPNPIDSIYENAAQRNLRKTDQIIISINNGFSKLKNTSKLMSAFSRIHNENKNVTLQLVGIHFEANGMAHKWAIEHNIEGGIEFLGHKSNSEVIDLLRNADILVHPSLEESFGNTLVEAMAQGTPCIGGKYSGAVPWVLDYGKAGTLIDVRSTDEIYSAIKFILENEKEWKKQSLASINNVKERFLLPIVSDLHIKKYHTILNEQNENRNEKQKSQSSGKIE
ncbi:MAG: glycosyltransferase family 4 protein [Proteiniphilum sp.]|nr:glycosyltransferase family 4 protein [Proteiniphilum sp.]MDY9918291.1 glycosyltransferase family 4 protein [Proteiniphilum sp.]